MYHFGRSACTFDFISVQMFERKTHIQKSREQYFWLGGVWANKCILFVGNTRSWKCKKSESKPGKGLGKQGESTSTKEQRNTVESRSQDE